jgi:hypothetical protein
MLPTPASWPHDAIKPHGGAGLAQVPAPQRIFQRGDMR